MTFFSTLFTQQSWQEFVADGCRIVGFRSPSTFNNSTKAMPVADDTLVCYVTGIQRWVGVLRVIGPSSDTRPIWTEGQFPLRFDVRPITVLAVADGLPMQELFGRVQFYLVPEDARGFRGFVRSSPNRFRRQTDGTLIVNLLVEREKSIAKRPPAKIPGRT